MDFHSKKRNFTPFTEVVACLIIIALLSWSAARIPIVETLADLKFTTRSVFIIGNLIIVAIFVQSGPSQTPNLRRDDQPREVTFVLNAEEVPKVRNETNSSELSLGVNVAKRPVKGVISEAEDVGIDVASETESAKIYRRTASARYERGVRPSRVLRPELRRSKTVKMGGGVEKGTFDDLSHEEFRRKIEAFIANQQRLIRSESVVTYGIRIK